MTERCDLILVAGGSSTRFGGELPKQFEVINGRPLYLWSLEIFLSWPNLGEVIVVVPEEWVLPVQESFQSLVNTKKIHVVSGGASRQTSATNGLRKLKSLSQNPWVMIHDGARPAILPELLERVWEARAASEHIPNLGGVVPGVKAKETVKEVEIDGAYEIVSDTLSREKLRVIQTPQLMKSDLLAYAYAKLSSLDAVDDASLMEKMGFKIIVVEGDYDNLKVTFAKDKERVSSWLRLRYPPI